MIALEKKNLRALANANCRTCIAATIVAVFIVLATAKQAQAQSADAPYGLTGAQSDKVDPTGTWKCEYNIGGQLRTLELTIKKDGDKFVGTMSWPDQKDAKLKDVKLKDETLTFSNVRKFLDNEFPIDYALEIDGDKFKGKAATEFGGSKQVYDIEGKRQKKEK